jgi:hypothetical protein
MFSLCVCGREEVMCFLWGCSLLLDIECLWFESSGSGVVEGGEEIEVRGNNFVFFFSCDCISMWLGGFLSGVVCDGC